MMLYICKTEVEDELFVNLINKISLDIAPSLSYPSDLFTFTNCDWTESCLIGTPTISFYIFL